MKTGYKALFLIVLLPLLAVSAVFSAQKSNQKPIRFDHSLHVVQNEMDCTDCHSGIQQLGSGGWLIPDHDVCSTCHDIDDEKSCGTCHLNPDDPVAVPPLQGRYEGFAHKVHTAAKVSCTQCHGEVVSGTETPAIPEMSDCQQCHLNETASLDCAVCHQGQRPRPDDHQLASWKESDHGLEASFGTSNCSQCHEQASCDECHQGINLYGSPHPPTWRFNHFSETAWGGECLVCHETRESCTSCHRTTLPLPHPLGPEFANDLDGGEHKEEAAAFPETCLTCHDFGGNDPTCARCHE